MDDVKKYNAYADGLTVHFEADSEGAWASADDFDAQRLRADTAEAEREGAKAANNVLREELRTERLRADAAVGDANEAEQKLAAAEQRISELTGLLQRTYDADLASRHCQPYNTTRLMDDIEAALNPKPEAGSHE